MADYTDWRRSLLARLQAPQTEDNLNFFSGWQQAEGPDGAERFNWLNTTRGQQFPSINSVGVRRYPDFGTGADQIARTIMGGYPGILSAIRSGSGWNAIEQAPGEFAKWSTGDPNNMDAASQYIRNMGRQPPVIDAQEMGFDPGSLSQMLEQIHQVRGQELAALDQRTAAANAQRNNAFSNLQQAQQEPQPQLSPQATFVSNLLGNLSQALSPRMGGQQVAQRAQGTELEGLQTARAEKMRLLADQYSRLADQADKLGNLKEAANFNAKSSKLMESLHLHMQASGIRARTAAAQGAATQAASDRAEERRLKKLTTQRTTMESQAKALDDQASLIERQNQKSPKPAKTMMAARRRAEAAYIRQKANEQFDAGEFTSFGAGDFLKDLMEGFVADFPDATKRELIQRIRETGGAQEYGVDEKTMLRLLNRMVPDDESMRPQPNAGYGLQQLLLRRPAPHAPFPMQ